MKMIKLAFQRETAAPVMALTFATAVCLTLVSTRILWTRNLHYAFLIWNLFLAWLPLIFSLLASDYYRKRSGRSWHFVFISACWLLFFPNAPYIFTDARLSRAFLGGSCFDSLLCADWFGFGIPVALPHAKCHLKDYGTPDELVFHSGGSRSQRHWNLCRTVFAFEQLGCAV